MFRVEASGDGKLRGWIVDTAQPEEPVAFTLVVGGEAVAEVRADAPRPDAARRFGTAGRHGFVVPVDPAWSNERPRSVRLQLADGRRVGPNRRMVVHAQAPAGAPANPADRELDRLTAALRRLRGGDLSAAPEVRDLMERTVVQPLVRRASTKQRWSDLAQLAELVSSNTDAADANRLMVARGLIYANQAAQAHDLLATAIDRHAHEAEWCFFFGLAALRADRAGEALPWLERAVEKEPDNGQYLRGLAAALARATRGGDQRAQARGALLERSVEIFDRAAERAKSAREPMLLGAAQALLDLGRTRAAIERIDAALAREPGSRAALFARSRALVALGELGSALEAAHAVLAVDPEHQGAQYLARTLSALVDGDATERPNRVALRVPPRALAGAWPAIRARLDAGVDTADWIAVADAAAGGEPMEALLAQAPRWCGRLEGRVDGAPVVLWRAELLRALHRSGLIGAEMDLAAALTALEPMVASASPGSAPAIPAARAPGGTVICMSRHGTRMFGGGEHFLLSMAEHYGEAGYEPVIVGAQPGQADEAGVTAEGVRWAMIDGGVDALRRFVLRERPAAVHVLSGLGFEVAHALQYLDVPFFYGVHFWRDCLGATEGSERFFADFDREPIARPLFNLVIERAAAIYTNSDYTRDILEEAFRIRTPVLYSLPRDDRPEDDPEAARALTGGITDYVVLLNARADKGFGLILDVAARVPDVPFVAVASQTNQEAALRLVAERRLANVHVIARTDRPDLLYRHALATAVPSYQFVETFSRVCIEAQRFGCPVIGSDKGNVPRLLRESGTVLPEDVGLWAAEIEQLARDPDYRAARRRLARENSDRYAYRRQADAVARLIPKIGRRILVAIGSGIGNMLHAGPAIRAIARHFGQPVDLVVAEDHAESLFLLHDPAVVSEVLVLGRPVLGRRYDVVFVTNSFGDMRPPFAGRAVLHSRDWQRFDPAGPLHETVHNLEAARALLGVEWTEADLGNAYVADLRYRPPAGGRLIGFHGGSKGGFWSSKRWPGHAELARRLAAHGWECASFGTAGEYVPGTIDRTGGSIAEMADALRDCSYVVTNDSGVMNIANALGVPLTALFAPTNPATRAPLRPTSTFLQVARSCSPCEVTAEGREVFHAGRCRCIEEIGVDTVEAHVLAHMAKLGIAPAL